VIIGLLTASALADSAESRVLGGGSVSDFYTSGLGGRLGHIISSGILEKALGVFGSFIVLLTVFLLCSIVLVGDNLGSKVREYLRGSIEKWRTVLLERRARKAQSQVQSASKSNDEDEVSSASQPPVPPVLPNLEMPQRGSTPDTSTIRSARENLEEEDPDDKAWMDSTPTLEDDPAPDAVEARDDGKPSPRKRRKKDPKGLKIIASEHTEKAIDSLPDKKGDYRFPSLELLDNPQADEAGADEDHQETANTLLRTLSEFGVKVTMGEVHAGPVITRYDIHPAAGVRVEKILSLDRNIALGLKATSVRILAPVPGKGCVGIEVPNKIAQPVSIREILESRTWAASKAEIPVALGREVSGKPLIADLTKMPHLLIAGATGAGKTVCINSIVTSLLYHSSPEDLRFVMVDPKIVEMQVFNDLPHMLIPVVTDPKKVPAALKYLLKEMENRYQIFAREGVRNIAGFNAKRAKDTQSEIEEKELASELSPEERAAVSTIEVRRDLDIEIPDKLPYIVCLVDELADLMMVAPADIETCIARLAQLARAAGIHLIIATQRPSVNVITGVIKANLPSRIAFKVASKVDSRTILDAMGADHLIGRGDMLFLPPGSADLVRSQGAFVGDDEIKNIVEFLKQNGSPEIDEVFQESVELSIDLEDEEESDTESDELLPDAIDVLRSTKRASTSMLQRRLRIGYNRAARIMEILEDRGIVGPENGAQPREILRDLDSI